MFGDKEHVKYLFGFLPRVRDPDHYNRISGYHADLWKALGVDRPATVMREAQGPNVYAYRFDCDEEPGNFFIDLEQLLGAAHMLEIYFVFNVLESVDRLTEGIFTEDNLPGRKALSNAMSSYWAEFAYNGSPGRGRDGNLPEWKPWDNSGDDKEKYIVFDTAEDNGLRMSSRIVTVDDIKSRKQSSL